MWSNIQLRKLFRSCVSISICILMIRQLQLYYRSLCDPITYEIVETRLDSDSIVN